MTRLPDVPLAFIPMSKPAGVVPSTTLLGFQELCRLGGAEPILSQPLLINNLHVMRQLTLVIEKGQMFRLLRTREGQSAFTVQYTKFGHSSLVVGHLNPSHKQQVPLQLWLPRIG
jgi:hypothetical protein